MSGVEAPRLSGASTRALGVAPIRIALGVGGVAGAVLRGLDGRPALAAAAAGGLVLTIIALGKSSRAGLRGEADPLPVPAGARYDSAWLAALLACSPSTIAVGLMTAVALVFSPPLAAVLGGVLLAMGALALVYGVQLAARERRESIRVWLERGPKPRTFVSAR